MTQIELVSCLAIKRTGRDEICAQCLHRYWYFGGRGKQRAEIKISPWQRAAWRIRHRLCVAWRFKALGQYLADDMKSRATNALSASSSGAVSAHEMDENVRAEWVFWL